MHIRGKKMERIIANEGKSGYHIVTSQFAHEAELYAASQLKIYLEKASFAVIPYFSDRCEKRTPEIRVGRNVRGNTDKLYGIGDEGFKIYTDGEDIVICGRTPRGTVYGVYRFLEEIIGFRCFTKDIEAFDKRGKIAVSDIDITENPSFEYRDTYFRGAFDCDYAVKNRLNSSLALIPNEKGGRTKFYNFHHSFYDILPPDIYFDEHPEYYSLVDGVRLKQNGQLCLTNEDAVNEAIKRVKEWIRSRPDCKVFSVAQNDWSNNCTCPKCRETDEKEGRPSGSIIYFVNRIAEEIEKEYPDVLIHTFAYQYSRKAPKFIRPRDNVIVRLCNIECSWDENLREKKANSPESYTAEFVGNITDWGKISKHLYIWDYACNFSYYILPFPNYYILADNLRYYKECGVSGILEQGNFSYGAATGLAELEAYLCARLMWNTDLDVKKLIMEFTDGVYGRSADYIRQYIELLCSEVKGKGLSLYYKPDTDFISEALINKADELFKKASNAAETAEIKERIEREYLSVRFLKICWMPLGTEGRNDLIDELYRDVKKHGISEIQERVNLEISFERLRKYPFCREKGENYRLYYIMK